MSKAKAVKYNASNHKIEYVARLKDIINPEGFLQLHHHWLRRYGCYAGPGKYLGLPRHKFLSWQTILLYIVVESVQWGEGKRLRDYPVYFFASDYIFWLYFVCLKYLDSKFELFVTCISIVLHFCMAYFFILFFFENFTSCI